MSIKSLYRQQLVVKRMVATVLLSGVTPGGVDTTLKNDTAVGATAIKLDAATGLAPGIFLRIGDPPEREIHVMSSNTGVNVILATPLQIPHDSGDAVVEVDDAGGEVLDDYGHPFMSLTTMATVPGLIQPTGAREVALADQAGVIVGSHIGFIGLLPGLANDCWLEVAGVRYDILAIQNAAGQDHHLELTLQAVS